MNVLNWIDQSAFLAFAFGLLCSTFFDTRNYSLLQMPEDSQAMLFSLKPLRKVYLKYPQMIRHALIIVLALLTGAVVYMFLLLSAGLHLGLNLLLQILFVMQAFPLHSSFACLIRGKKYLLQYGTSAGLEFLSKPLFRQVKHESLELYFRNIIRTYLHQLNLFWVIPFLIFYFSSLPFVFLYLAFVIQLETFQEQSLLYRWLTFLPYNLMITILRILLIFLSFSKEQKNNFSDKYLEYQTFMPLKKAAENSSAAALRSKNQILNLDELTILLFLVILFLSILISIMLCFLYLKI